MFFIRYTIEHFITLHLSFIFELTNNYILCGGITMLDPGKEFNYQKHVIPKKFNYLSFQQQSFQSHLHQDEYYRSNDCRMLLSTNDKHPCLQCVSHNIKVMYSDTRKEKKMLEPAKLKAPIKFTSPERIKLT